jgi:hypothetical protein
MIEDAATMYPLKVDVKNPFEIQDVGRNHKVQDVADAMSEAGLINGEEWWSIVDKAVIDFSTGAEDLAASQPAWERAREILAESGYDSLSYVNTVEDAGSEVIMPLYQDQVRSRWAQFDPDKKLSPSLMAGSAGAAVLAGSEKSEASEVRTPEEILAQVNRTEVGSDAPVRSVEEILASVNSDDAIPAMDGGDGLGTIETVLGYWNQYNRGVTMGGSDEIVARGRAALDEWIDERTGAGKIIEDATGDPYKDLDNFSEVVKMYEKDERIRRDAFLDANPISGTLMEIAGGMVTGGATFKALSALAPAAGMGIRGAGAGLIDGAIYGFLDGDGTVAERFENAAKLAGGGLLLGAAMPKALEVLGKGAAAAGSKISKFRADRKLMSTAGDVYNNVSDNIIIARAQGLDEAAAVEAALQTTRTSPQAYASVKELLGKTSEAIPSVQSAKLSAPGIEASKRSLSRTPSGWLRKVGKPSEYLKQGFVKIVDRLAEQSPELANALRDFEMRVHRRTGKWMEQAQQFETAFKQLNSAQKEVVARALRNRDWDDATEILGYQVTRPLKRLLNEVGFDLKGVGYDLRMQDGYFPSHVKDYDGLMQQMGSDFGTELQQKLATVTNDGQRNRIIAEHFKKTEALRDGNLSHTKARTYDKVSNEMMKFYDDPINVLSSYIHQAASDIEMKTFFDKSGGGGSLRQLLNKRAHDLDVAADGDALQEAIGALIEKSGKIGDFMAEKEIRAVLSARFGPGRQSMGEFMRGTKNLGTTAALANVPSTITQLGDIANGLYLNGIRSTLKGVVRAARDNGYMHLDDIGLDNRLTIDVNADHVGWTSKLLDTSLGWTGFKKMDRFGKRVLIEGAMNKATKQLTKQGAKGEAAFRKQWGATFGDETDSLIAAIRNSEVDDNVRLMAYNVVSDAQPISLSEMPEAYLRHPNGRLLYTLKSYAVNQINLLKKTIKDPRVPDKTKGEAITDLGRFLMYTGLVNGTVEEVKDLVRLDVEQVRPEDIPMNVAESLLKLGFQSRYTMDRYIERGDIKGWLLNMVAPPMPHFTSPAKNIPVAGTYIDDFFMGGRDKRAKRLAKERGEFYLDTSLDMDLDLDLDL